MIFCFSRKAIFGGESERRKTSQYGDGHKELQMIEHAWLCLYVYESYKFRNSQTLAKEIENDSSASEASDLQQNRKLIQEEFANWIFYVSRVTYILTEYESGCSTAHVVVNVKHRYVRHSIIYYLLRRTVFVTYRVYFEFESKNSFSFRTLFWVL